MAVKINEIVTTTSINTDDKVVVTQNGTETRRANAKDLVDKFTEGIKTNVSDLTKTVQDNKTEILSTIGDEEMGLSATSVKGAIKEINGKVEKNATQLNENVQDLETVKTDYAKKTDVNDLASNKAEKTELQKTNNELETQKARIDNFTKLSEGSTTGDAELQDIRVKSDGTKAESAGTAVREQFKDINKKIANSINIFDKDDLIEGYFYSSSSSYTTPTLTANENFKCKLYAVLPGTTYIVSKMSYDFIFFDSSKNKISALARDRGTNISFTTPSDCYYLAISVDKVNANLDTFMFVQSDTMPSEYVPYNIYIYKSPYVTSEQIKNIIDNKVDKYEEYHVGNTGVYQYTSLTQCLKDLQGNNNEKTIYIHGGTYDIFEEYGGTTFAESVTTTAWRDWSIRVPKNTHIVGIGDVILEYMPVASNTTVNCSIAISVLNIDDTCSVENIEINAKNCRYCIHDETNGLDEYNGAVKKYKNIKCYHYANDDGYGYGQAYACGFDQNMKFEFDNCYFEAEKNEALSFHNRSGNIEDSSRITINNCIFIAPNAYNDRTVRFGNVNTIKNHVNVSINNSHINGHVAITNESSTATGVKNAYDITLLNCNKMTPEITTTDNEYPIKQYNPIG